LDHRHRRDCCIAPLAQHGGKMAMAVAKMKMRSCESRREPAAKTPGNAGASMLALTSLLAAVSMLPASSAHATAAQWQRRRHMHTHAAYLRAGHERTTLPKPTAYNFSQTTDHFNFETLTSPDDKFTQRWLTINEANYTKQADRSTVPIFVFTGAEGGNVEETAWAYSFIIDMACEMGALTVLLEHRFFGRSVPFGGNATEALLPRPDRVGLLSVEQAMSDYAALIAHVRDKFGAWDAPVITFGGSLAGTLAAFMRLRYPQLVDMAVASSAPVRGYPGLMEPFAWHKQVTDNFEDLAPGCPDLVRSAFASVAQAWPGGALGIQRDFNTCEPASSPLVSSGTIQGVAWQKVEGWGEFVYPLATSNRSTIGPACRRMAAAAAADSVDGGQPATKQESRKKAASIMAALINTPNTTCLNLTAFKAEGDSPGSYAWDYLACTEIVHPIGANNVTDMFPPFNWTLAATDQQCNGVFGPPNWDVHPRPTWIPDSFGLAHLRRFAELPSSTSKIIFTYGLRDPWHVGGLLSQGGLTGPPPYVLNNETEVVVIEDGSHCADMAPPSDDDSPTMLGARAKVKATLKGWLAEFHARQ
jgi:lysosomal Pro-X carboxypeptidase